MAILEAIKSANQEYVFITNDSQKLTYTIILKNNSNSLAQNVVVTDIIPHGAVFIPNTFSLNGMNVAGANPNCGVDIGNLQKGKMAVVTFDIEICSQCPFEQIENYATITYVDYSNEGSTESLNTNVVTTQIASLCVNINKSVDKCAANKNDILNYTILIENNSNIEIDNIVLTDIIPAELTVMPSTVLVNGSKISGDLNQGINLGTLCAGGIIIVVFQAKVDYVPHSLSIDNMANIQFEYSIYLEDTIVTSNGFKNSNVVSTAIGPNSFKQIMISSKLAIPCSQNGVCEIINKFVDVEITSTEIIDTIKGMSCEGENLTGKKMVVNGTLMERIEYIELCSDKSIKVAEYNIHFNTFIVLPENYNEINNIQVESFIEDIDMRLIDTNTLYQSISLLLDVVY